MAPSTERWRAACSGNACCWRRPRSFLLAPAVIRNALHRASPPRHRASGGIRDEATSGGYGVGGGDDRLPEASADLDLSGHRRAPSPVLHRPLRHQAPPPAPIWIATAVPSSDRDPLARPGHLPAPPFGAPLLLTRC
ncbi:hypothetical protein E2562_004876 [Oryza meyeriana var. granulata]|uniref:Uncharacterized protein n=1 Tax=Oryza meyeriana var. granulata TaxID=110450 RepID=A0A6G1C337_9ORYZ|nr:hypothetical protein E2562_004876 [Oryza meyeriana var. granulata]